MRYLITLILFLIGCVIGSAEYNSQYDTHYIDGCWYIITAQGGIVHKANCSNSYHKE